MRRDRARYVRTGNVARGGWPVKLAALLLGCWSPRRSRRMTVRIGEVAGVDAERAHVGWCRKRAAGGWASRSNSSTSVCDAAGIPRLNSVELGSPGDDVVIERRVGLPFRLWGSLSKPDTSATSGFDRQRTATVGDGMPCL